MKINQLIAKGLSIGFLLNSLSILSYANTEISNRYQTLEGEYITINDSMEGNLEEIEVFGNTTQNHNNLEDIQSVGDLYVDKDGNPILDSQGREQFLLNIETWDGLNYLDMRTINYGRLIHSNGEVDLTQKEYVYTDYIKLTNIKANNYLSFKCFDNVNYVVDRIVLYDGNKNHVQSVPYVSEGGTLSYAKDGMYMRVGFYLNKSNYSLDEVKSHRWMMSYDISDYKERASNSFTLILPTQLQKIGDTSDRLYWDSKKNKYCIDKRIMYDNFEKGIIENQAWSGQINSINFHYRINDFFGNWGILRAYCNTLMSGVAKQHYGQDTFGFITDTGGIVIKLPRNELSSLDTNGCMQWLKDRDSYLYYVSKNTETIETNITSKLKIPTYNGKTYIYANSENNINPTLKVVVDRLPQIAKNSVEEAELNSNINNIALARIYVNMLPESLYKDQLQEQLSEIFSSDMVLDKKSVTSNLDLYIKCENILMMSLSTNNITFEDFSGVEDMIKENAVQISINSSLPYQLNAYLPVEIQNSDKSVTMDKDILNIKENSESAYQTFSNTTDNIILKDNCSGGNDLIHNINIKLKGGIAHEKDVYKTTIKFEVEQK